MCRPLWVDFWAENSLNKGPFFGRFSINMGGLPRDRQQMAKNRLFPSKIHHKSGYDVKFW